MMRTILAGRVVLRTLFVAVVTFICVPLPGYAQSVHDAIVEVPTARDGDRNSALIEIPTAQTVAEPISAENVTMAGAYKATKNVIEEEKEVFWRWYTDVGYESQYNFRGTNLTPDSDGAGFFNARVSKWNFTFGVFGIHQFGKARAPSWSIGEGGGAAGGAGADAPSVFGPVPYTRFPTTIQDRFNELDVFLSYKFSLGFIDVTIGNIAFFIDRRATTFETDVLPPLFHGLSFVWVIPPTFRKDRTLGPDPTVQDEQFDRVYITLSTTKISRYITPQITYYQTVLSEGSQPTQDGTLFYAPVTFPFPPFPQVRPSNPRPFNERNESLGGYLEGRINSSFPITRWADFNPYGIISVSFRDRTEPGGANPYAGHPLTGWNHVQAGVELPIHLAHLGGVSGTRWAAPDANLYLVPFGAYAYHISNPPPGTDRDEWWGGGKLEITF